MFKYQPKEGSIVYCDFSGFIEPEIIKKRPVVIIHKHRHNPGLVTVVPISTTQPKSIQNFHYEFEELFQKKHLGDKKCWCKCDLVYVVSIERLDRFKNHSTRKREVFCVTPQTLKIIKEMVRLANGL